MDADKFAQIMADNFNDSVNPYKKEWVDKAAIAITERDKRIRAEALKDAAERFRVISCPLIFNERTVKPESCDKCTRMLGPRYCTEVAAILAEEVKDA